jgi:TadE-like protein
MTLVRRVHSRPHARHNRAQALVELALVMPVLVGIIAVLFQFGILFVAYLSLVHETRDIGRFVAVHPDIVDGGPSGSTAPCASPPTGSLWAHVCGDLPSVIDPMRVQDAPLVTPACASLSGGRCTSRTTGSQLHIQMAYDASTITFLPTTFRLGPWFQVSIPAALPTYDYYVMVEQH